MSLSVWPVLTSNNLTTSDCYDLENLVYHVKQFKIAKLLTFSLIQAPERVRVRQVKGERRRSHTS